MVLARVKKNCDKEISPCHKENVCVTYGLLIKEEEEEYSVL
jgi:hypothetical protein